MKNESKGKNKEYLFFFFTILLLLFFFKENIFRNI